MMLVLPNTMGIGIYSPLVDDFGNSVRGIRFCEELVRVFNFHRYDNTTKFSSKVQKNFGNFFFLKCPFSPDFG